MPDKIMSILAEATGGKCTDKEILDVLSYYSITRYIAEGNT